MLDRTINSSITLIKLWGRGAIGFALTRAYLSDEPWISAGDVSQVLGISDDTARRWLDQLVAVGRVHRQTQLGRKLYRADPALAERTIELVEVCFRPIGI